MACNSQERNTAAAPLREPAEALSFQGNVAVLVDNDGQVEIRLKMLGGCSPEKLLTAGNVGPTIRLATRM
jgi:hypothetical protein